MNEDVENSAQKAKERKGRYKKSLNLPKTSFGMRANLHQNEPASQKRWAKDGLYEAVLEQREGSPPFLFHDGPPYANGSIHVGHLLNKVLKDLVVRTRNMSGLLCPYIPGWDCHGLPIEHKVLSGMIESGKIEKIKSLTEDQRRMAVRRACAAYAEKFKKLQTAQMQRLLTLADYADPYMTMAPRYEQAVLGVFEQLLEEGIVFRALKPVHWSIANETALAEAELEYMDRVDPSIYVYFDCLSSSAIGDVFGVSGLETTSLMIWTTTPWTIPANLLVAVHPKFDYSLVRLDGRATVIATELVTKVAALTGSEPEVLAQVKGDALLGLEYRHPFIDRIGRVVEADYVTFEDGTGLVHTAPGHGQDDYLTGMREGTEVYSPVQDDGTYDESVPEWIRGLSVWDANPLIVERLRESGHLYLSHDYTHSYPHDWRSRTPVIFRCTEQWFIGVDMPTATHGRSLRQLALDATDSQIEFIPAWGKNRMRGMLESRPDWCISRQRAWGLPIPAFQTETGETFLTRASVRAVAEVFGNKGSDAWFTMDSAQLLADYDPASDPEAPEGLNLTTLEKLYDIFDVWFESGSSWNAVMRQRNQGYPVDLYLEGSDQHRGWFQTSLIPALGATGQSPFRSVLTHGFMVDRDGRKMSKSLGNTLEVDELLKDFGADVCRWWVSSLAFENDIKVDLEFFQLAGESYRKVRNTLRFLLSNLNDFDAEIAVPLEDIHPVSLDGLALARTAELRRSVLKAYEKYEFRQAHLLLFDFCNDTLSSLYLNAVKDRLYCDTAESPRRRATQTALWHITNVLSTLLAPILPHTADEAYRSQNGDSESVHLQTFSELDYTADSRWETVLATRTAGLRALEGAKSKGIENPLDAGLRVGDPDGILKPFEADLADVFGVSRVELHEGAGVEILDLREQPRCERSWKRDGTVQLRSDGGWLSDRDALATGVE